MNIDSDTVADDSSQDILYQDSFFYLLALTENGSYELKVVTKLPVKLPIVIYFF
jgi:hypothetical protein